MDKKRRRKSKIPKYQPGGDTLFVTDPKDPRLQAYKDSLKLYNTSVAALEWARKNSIDTGSYYPNVTIDTAYGINSGARNDHGRIGVNQSRHWMLVNPNIRDVTHLNSDMDPLGWNYSKIPFIQPSGGFLFKDGVADMKYSSIIPTYKKPNQPVKYQEIKPIQLQDNFQKPQLLDIGKAEMSFPKDQREFTRFKQPGDIGNEKQKYRITPDGKTVPTFQDGGRASRQDSLDVYNQALKVLDYYRSKNYTSNYENYGYYQNDFLSLLDNSFRNFKLNNIVGPIYPSRAGKSEMKPIPEDVYRKIVDSNKFYQRENASAILDTRAPASLYDKRITPTGYYSFINTNKSDILHDDAVSIYGYDPIAVKPDDLLTKEERELREQRYGKPENSSTQTPTKKKQLIAEPKPIVLKDNYQRPELLDVGKSEISSILPEGSFSRPRQPGEVGPRYGFYTKEGKLMKMNDGGIMKKKYSIYNSGGLSRKEDYGSKKKPYPSVNSDDFAGGDRSYPIPSKADAIDALRLAGLHGRDDVRKKVYAKYPDLKKAHGGIQKYLTAGFMDSEEGPDYEYNPLNPEDTGLVSDNFGIEKPPFDPAMLYSLEHRRRTKEEREAQKPILTSEEEDQYTKYKKNKRIQEFDDFYKDSGLQEGLVPFYHIGKSILDAQNEDPVGATLHGVKAGISGIRTGLGLAGALERTKQENIAQDEKFRRMFKAPYEYNIDRGSYWGARQTSDRGDTPAYYYSGGKHNITNNMNPNAELDKDEGVILPSGKTFNMGTTITHNQGGINVNIPTGTKMTSDNLKLIDENGKPITYAKKQRKIGSTEKDLESYMEAVKSNDKIAQATALLNAHGKFDKTKDLWTQQENNKIKGKHGSSVKNQALEQYGFKWGGKKVTKYQNAGGLSQKDIDKFIQGLNLPDSFPLKNGITVQGGYENPFIPIPPSTKVTNNQYGQPVKGLWPGDINPSYNPVLTPRTQQMSNTWNASQGYTDLQDYANKVGFPGAIDYSTPKKSEESALAIQNWVGQKYPELVAKYHDTYGMPNAGTPYDAKLGVRWKHIADEIQTMNTPINTPTTAPVVPTRQATIEEPETTVTATREPFKYNAPGRKNYFTEGLHPYQTMGEVYSLLNEYKEPIRYIEPDLPLPLKPRFPDIQPQLNQSERLLNAVNRTQASGPQRSAIQAEMLASTLNAQNNIFGQSYNMNTAIQNQYDKDWFTAKSAQALAKAQSQTNYQNNVWDQNTRYNEIMRRTLGSLGSKYSQKILENRTATLAQQFAPNFQWDPVRGVYFDPSRKVYFTVNPTAGTINIVDDDVTTTGRQTETVTTDKQGFTTRRSSRSTGYRKKS